MSESRTRFERWAKRDQLVMTRTSDRENALYHDYETQLAWLAWSARDSEVERLREALTTVLQHFPTDGDMAEAGWTQTEINAACDAHEAARLLLSSQVKESGK